MRMWILGREATEKWTLTDNRRTSEYRNLFIINPRRRDFRWNSGVQSGVPGGRWAAAELQKLVIS